MPNKFFQNTIAIIYDFDGTLSPQPMQEYTVLSELGIKGEHFWEKVGNEAQQTNAEMMLVYLRLLIEESEKQGRPITSDNLKKMAISIKYFQGVEEWFKLINAYVLKQSRGNVKIKHYIISAGNREILEGITIRDYFEKIYASEYFYDGKGKAVFPKVLVTDTTKTQFIFRINKGKEELYEEINDHMDDRDRPIPFSNIVYVGDGASDVPSMAVTRKNGGHAIAVYDPDKVEKASKCEELLLKERVDYYLRYC